MCDQANSTETGVIFTFFLFLWGVSGEPWKLEQTLTSVTKAEMQWLLTKSKLAVITQPAQQKELDKTVRAVSSNRHQRDLVESTVA